MLIKNLPMEEFSVERLLVEYKQPTSIEQMFRSLKDSLFVHAFFLHQAERVEALGYVLLMARQVFATGERQVRAAGAAAAAAVAGSAEEADGTADPEPPAGCDRDTGWARAGEVYVQPSFRRTFMEILAMAGFDESLYTCVPTRAAA